MKINYEDFVAIAASIGSNYTIGGFQKAREAWDSAFSEDDTIQLKDYRIIPLIVDTISLLYNPADKGRSGKVTEVEERLIYWSERRPYCKKSELHARKTGRSDLGKGVELKSGTGDWLYSFRYSTRESIINEYRRSRQTILWTTESFRIRCSWPELFEYLEQYNEKGLDTWFKRNVKHNPMMDRYIVQMQEYKTSKKKIAYLQACPYCE